MKMLFICKCSPLKEGGAEARSKEVAFELARRGHEVTILCAKTDLREPADETRNRVRIICRKVLPDFLLKRAPYPGYFLLGASSLFLMFHVRAFLKKEKFDFVREDISPFPPSGLLALKRLPAQKRVAVVHNLSGTLKGWIKFYGPVYGLAGYLMDRFLRAGILKYDRIICAGKWFADELKQFPKIADRVVYVPNGVNLDLFKSDGAEPNDSVSLRLLSVGRLVETKGHRYLIEAMAKIKNEFPQMKLDIVGDGQLKQQLRELAERLGVGDRVEFLPLVAHDKMPEIYRRYDFFVMPSVFEGLPISLIEAMATGLPIIATDIPGITSILDRSAATIAATENSMDLAEKMRWAFLNREEVLKKALVAYEMARRYDWQITAREEIDEPIGRHYVDSASAIEDKQLSI
jgi:glycosyltransferase involved in cell wall biosynthesis